MLEDLKTHIKSITGQYKVEEIIYVMSQIINEKMYHNDTMSEDGKYNFMNLAADMMVDEYVKYTTERLESEGRERAKNKVVKYDFERKRYL